MERFVDLHAAPSPQHLGPDLQQPGLNHIRSRIHTGHGDKPYLGHKLIMGVSRTTLASITAQQVTQSAVQASEASPTPIPKAPSISYAFLSKC